MGTAREVRNSTSHHMRARMRLPMIDLTTLGSVNLRRADGEVIQSVLAQPKRAALLIYLAVARPHGLHQRDVLLTLFWGERDDQAARKALRQALYYLRTSLGDDVIATIGDTDVGVARNRITCDAVELVNAFNGGRFEQAWSLYTGELLHGFHVDDAPEFENWLNNERTWLRTKAAEAAWQVASAREAAGDHAGTAVWALRAAALSPADETVLRRLMLSLQRVGDRAAALRAFDEFVHALRRDYELEPTKETVALAEALRARSTTPAHEKAIQVSVPPVETPHEQPDPRDSALVSVQPGSRARLGPVAGLLGSLIALIAIMLVAFDKPMHLNPAEILVIPFAVVEHDTALAPLAESMPLLLAARLHGDHAVRATDYSTLKEALRRNGLGGRKQSRRRAVGLARDLSAGRVLTGAVGTSPRGMAMTAELIDARSGDVKARASAEGAVERADSLIDDLVATVLSRAAGEPEQRIPLLRRVPLEALLSYLHGQALRQSGRPRRAREAFLRALDHDSTFATAALAASIAASSGGPSGEPDEWIARGNELAWRWRQLLAQVDSEVVMARLGPRFPAPSTSAEEFAAWEALVQRAGSHPYESEIHMGYADHLFHYGQRLGITTALEQARTALERSYRMGPHNREAVMHLTHLAFIQHDTTLLRVNVERVLSRETDDTTRNVLRWMLAVARGDTSRPAQLPRDLDDGSLYNLSQNAGYGLDDAERVLLVSRNDAATVQAVVEDLRRLFRLALNRGQPQRAHALLDTIDAKLSEAPHLKTSRSNFDRVAVRMVLFADGDITRIRSQLARVAKRASLPLPAGAPERAQWYSDRCVMEEWRLFHGQTATVDAAIATLATGSQSAQLCARILTVFAATVRGDPRAPALLDSLDSLSRTVPPEWENQHNLLIAQLFERQGRLLPARAAAARRGIFYSRFTGYIAQYVREEGRLALEVGDTAGAVKAWRVFVGLWDAAEPHQQQTRTRVLRTLEALTSADAAGAKRR